MSDKTRVLVNISKGPNLQLDRGDKLFIYRESVPDKEKKSYNVIIELNNSKIQNSLQSSLLSGKDSSRGPHNCPYVIEVNNDYTVDVNVYNSSNSVDIEAFKEQISLTSGTYKIDDFGAKTRIKIGRHEILEIKIPANLEYY